MKHFWIRLLAAPLLFSSAFAQTGWVTMTGANLTDATGAPISNGTACWQVTTNAGTPIGVHVGGSSGGQTATRPPCGPVNNGALVGAWQQADPTAAGTNLIPDPVITGFTSWTNPGAAWEIGSGANLGTSPVNGLTAQAGASGTTQTSIAGPITVTPGQVYTFSGFIILSSGGVGSGEWVIGGSGLTTIYASGGLASGPNGTVRLQFVVPAGVTQVYVGADVAAATIPSGQTLSFARPLLQAGASQLPDVNLSTPQNACMQLTVTDNTSGNTLLGGPGSGYSCVQPQYTLSSPPMSCAAGVCNLDSYLPTTTPQVAQTTGPTGPAGPGINYVGNWTANTAYVANDVYTESGTNYAVLSAYTSGSTYGSTDTAHNTTFTITDATARSEASSAQATANAALPLAGGTMSGPLNGPSLNLSVVCANTSSDVTNINTALASALATSAPTHVSVYGVTCDLPSTLVIGSNTWLDVSPTTTMTGTTYGAHLIETYASNYGVNRSTTDGASTASSSTITSATINCTTADVGRPFRLSTAGQPAESYSGLTGYWLTPDLYGHVVSCNSTTSFRSDVPAYATTSAQTLKFYNWDTNIKITGGIWYRSYANAGNNIMNMVRVNGLLIQDAVFNSPSNTTGSLGGLYAIQMADANQVRVDKVTMPFVLSDGVHLDGPDVDVSITNLVANTGDDTVVITTRDWAGPSALLETGANEIYGSVYGWHLDGIHGSSRTSLVRFGSTQGLSVKHVSAHDIYASSPSGGVITADDPFFGGGFTDDIVIDGVGGQITSVSRNENVFQSTQTNVGDMVLKNIDFSQANISCCNAIVVMGNSPNANATLNSVMVDGLKGTLVNGAVQSAAVYVSQNATVKNLTVANADVTMSGSTTNALPFVDVEKDPTGLGVTRLSNIRITCADSTTAYPIGCYGLALNTNLVSGAAYHAVYLDNVRMTATGGSSMVMLYGEPAPLSLLQVNNVDLTFDETTQSEAIWLYNPGALSLGQFNNFSQYSGRDFFWPGSRGTFGPIQFSNLSVNGTYIFCDCTSAADITFHGAVVNASYVVNNYTGYGGSGSIYIRGSGFSTTGTPLINNSFPLHVINEDFPGDLSLETAPAVGDKIFNTNTTYGPNAPMMYDGSHWRPIAGGFHATTGSIGGSSVASGACATGSVTINGAAVGMNASAAPATSTTPGAFFTVSAGPITTANTVPVNVCNQSAGALTPTAATYTVTVN